MARIEPRFVTFVPHRPEEAVAEMETLTAAGAGWINFQPAIDEEDVPPPESAAFGLFSGRGPAVPLATWTPESATKRGRVEPSMIGLQHPAGTRAKKRLAEVGHPVPDGWPVVQDHARKGLVVNLPDGVAPADALDWLLRAAAALSTVPLAGEWRASVYQPATRSQP